MRSAAWLALLSVLLGACAAPSMQAQWRSPALDSVKLAGQPVWVSCVAREQTLAMVCEDQLATQLAAAGVKALRAAPGQVLPAGAVLANAKGAGAVALLSMKLESGVRPSSSGASLGIGIGGGSWGSGGGGGVSGGIALPIGGNSGETLSGEASLTQASDGQVLWSGTASSGAGSASGQIEGLARTTIDALRQAGVL